MYNLNVIFLRRQGFRMESDGSMTNDFLIFSKEQLQKFSYYS